MRAQTHIDNLRGSDPKTLEILIQDAIRKPIGMLSHQTLADLVALSEVDDLPRTLSRDLDAFATRVGKEIADLPKTGNEMRRFLAGFGELDPRKVPDTIREYLETEAQREERDPRDRELAKELLAQWSEQEPERVTLGTTAPRIQRAEAVAQDDEDDISNSRAVRARKPRTVSAPVQTQEDVERTRWISTTVLERLAPYREKGLAELVLVAGVRKDAADSYPDLMPFEITKVLRQLQDSGQVRHSAGRWSMAGRFW